jgi:heme-degrading monooxygenase HmoA
MNAPRTSAPPIARGARAVTLLSALVLTLHGCDDADKPTPEQRASTAQACSHDVLEPDLEADAFVGPAVDPTTGALMLAPGGRYVVSSTYGVPKPDPDGTPVSQRYLTLFAAVEAQLAQQPGLLALALGQSQGCHAGRTLALWRSEEEMYDFVTSPAHLAAMRAARDILQPGYAVTHWDATSAEDVTFARAVAQLAKIAPAP